MTERELLIETIAEALFNSVGHYHSELTWEQAAPEHRAFNRKQAEKVLDAIGPYLAQCD